MSVLRLCVLCLLAVLGVSSARAQCTPVWQPFDPSNASIPGVDGDVDATFMWDPDGPGGPQTPRLVVGGSFTVARTTLANNIAVYDPATGQWSPLGSGMNGPVRALAVLPNGNLVAAGAFTTAGGVSANNIARWNGSAWSRLGAGVSSSVEALAVLPNGDLVAGGFFTTAGGVSVNRIARWNGSVWSALGSGMVGQSFVAVNALAVLPNGNLVAGGTFTTAGGVSANNIARWNGSAWSALGTGMSSSQSTPSVAALAVLPNGNLVAGGKFTTAGGVSANSIARWNGSAWSRLGSVVQVNQNNVNALAVLPNGDLVAGGTFIEDLIGQPNKNIGRWNGSAWSSLGSGMDGEQSTNLLFDGGRRGGSVATVAVLPSGDIVAGGSFTTAGGVSAEGIARWNGSAWSPLGSGTGGGSQPFAYDLAVLLNGDLVAGGWFTTAGGVSANYIARWNGLAWSPMRSGMNNAVHALAVLPNGNLVAGGFFSTAGGVSANGIARWNGSAWSPLGSGMNNAVNALAVLPNGDLVAGGEFTTAGGQSASRVARWNGSAWSPLGSGMAGGGQVPAEVYALAVLPNGNLVAGAGLPQSRLGVIRFGQHGPEDGVEVVGVQ